MVKFVDINDDKIINWRDRVVIGRGTTPEIMYGLNLSCDYKGFDLSTLWQGAANFNISFSSHMQVLTINSVWNSFKFLYDGRWTPDNPSRIPATTPGSNTINHAASDLWIRPADYIRLKNFNLGLLFLKI
jgi:hypothetical protein